MEYINAVKILPEHLIKEIQKYTEGSILYIPQSGTQRGWGESNGTKKYYITRNQRIRQDYANGKTIFAMTEEYGLAYSTVKKIIYQR